MTQITKKEVYFIAKVLKKTIKKDKKLPSKITINKQTYSYEECAYILAHGINHLNEKFTLINIKKPSNITGEKINENIAKDDFLDQAKRVEAYIKEHKQCPSTVKTVKSKTKVGVVDYIYAFARIVVWYYKHKKTLPKQCLYKNVIAPKTASKKKKYGHATQHGCDQMGQNTGYYCGVHSLQEVFRNLTGIVVKQSTLASVAGTTTSGTPHSGLDTTVAWFNRTYDFDLEVEWKNFSDLGWGGIKKIIESDNKDCVVHNLYRNQWGHYETVNGVSDSNIKVQNSLGSYCGPCYCGYVENRAPSTFRSYIGGISQKSIMVIERK